MEVFWTDSYEDIVVGEEFFTVDEFVEMYGEDSLPESKDVLSDAEIDEMLEELRKKEDFYDYYEALLELFNGMGNYQYFKKLGDNADDGVFIAQKIRRDYGHEGNVYDIELDSCKKRCLYWFRELSLRGTTVGFLPINRVGRDRIFCFIKDRDRRRYVRDVAKRARKRGELVSIADLMQKRYDLERKRAAQKTE